MLPAYKDLVVYEIYPDSFKDDSGDGFGDLKGIISKLDYVKGLGFNAIWLNPIYDSPFKDGGYDIRNPFLVSKRYGTNEDLKDLINEMHKRDMALFLDLVPGHMSIENEKFINSAKAYTNDCSNLFIWNSCVWDLEPNYRLISGMYDRNGCYLVNFFAHQPAINYGFNKIVYPSWQQSYKEVKEGREFLESIMEFYLDYGVDGFRVDMADSLVKNDDTKVATIWLWQQIRQDLAKKGYKDFFMTSEWSCPERALKAGFNADFVLDHQNNFSHYLFRQTEGEHKNPLLVKFDKELFSMFVSDVNNRVKASKKFHGNLAIISGNHDTWRIANYLNEQELKLAYLFILTMPGVPYVYYGDELGFHTDTSMPSFQGGYQRTGSRLPMKFDHSKNAGFSSANQLFLPQLSTDICVEDAKNDENSLYKVIKDLIQVRKENDDLTSSEFNFLNGHMAYKRNNLTVIINLEDDTQAFTVSMNAEVVYQIGEAKFINNQVYVGKKSGLIIKG